MFMEFEWDPKKAKRNLSIHKVDFNEATAVFYDDLAVDDFDDTHSDDEEYRFTILGNAANRLLLVVYTVRQNERIRLISARKATRSEASIYDETNKET